MQVRIVLREYSEVERERERAFVRGFLRALSRNFRFFVGEFSLSLSLLSKKAGGEFEPFSECTFGGNARECDA